MVQAGETGSVSLVWWSCAKLVSSIKTQQRSVVSWTRTREHLLSDQVRLSQHSRHNQSSETCAVQCGEVCKNNPGGQDLVISVSQSVSWNWWWDHLSAADSWQSIITEIQLKIRKLFISVVSDYLSFQWQKDNNVMIYGQDQCIEIWVFCWAK